MKGLPQERSFDLLVLGDCNPDLILSGNEIEPRFGQVERVLDGAELTIGGSGSIVACGAARLGLRTALISVVGDDLFGRFMIDALGTRGVDTKGIATDLSKRTGLTVILDRGDDRAMLTFPGTIAALGPGRIDRELLTSARHVHVSSFFLQEKLAPALPELLERAREAGASTSIDPNWDPDERWNSGLDRALPHTDVFLPNAEEAMRIAKRPDPPSAARELAKHGPFVAMKLGRDGAIAVTHDGQLTTVQNPANRQPVDAIGAGDSFDAGVLSGVLHGWSTERALALGCACGGLSTRAAGGTAAQPTLEEALEALEEPA
jgi:sugar/nucleoside kinase (ribokinase family)